MKNIIKFYSCDSSTKIESYLKELQRKTGVIMTKLSDLEMKFTTITEQLNRASVEITTQIQNLRNELANHPHEDVLPEGAETALTALMTVAESLDAMNDDVVPPVE